MDKVKKYLFALLLIGLLIPAIQNRIKFMNVKPLYGSFNVEALPKYSWSSWFLGTFQPALEVALDQNMLIRPAFVRLNNQLNYSLFNLANAKSVVIGKEGYLFEEGYINSYLGHDGVNEGAIKLKIEKAKYVQRELEKRGKHLLILLVPGKASYYSEYIPDRYLSEGKKTSYYDLFSKHLPGSGLNYIDLKGYFLKMKNKTPFPLYPKQGVHWSSYGATLAMDSIINYIKYDFKIDVPTMTINEIDTPIETRDSDYDIGDGMNLILKMSHNQMGYPKIKFDTDTNKIRPNVLTIGDSHFWTLIGFGLNKNVFKNNAFWYYNKIAYVAPYKEAPVNPYNLRKEIDSQDIIILLQTEVYYNNIGMGFIESAYSLYKNNW